LLHLGSAVHYIEHQRLQYSRTNRNEVIRGWLHSAGGGPGNVHVIAGPTSIGYGTPQNNRFSRVPRVLGFMWSPYSWTPEEGEDGFRVHSSPLLVGVLRAEKTSKNSQLRELRFEVFIPPHGDDAMRAWRMLGLYLLTVKPERMQAP
jgi:hypothetical protein